MTNSEKLIEVPPELVQSAKEALEKFSQFNKWMLTTTLAVIAFFFSVLIQIKFQSQIQYQNIAIATIIILIISILFGFYYRIRRVYISDVCQMGSQRDLIQFCVYQDGILMNERIFPEFQPL